MKIPFVGNKFFLVTESPEDCSSETEGHISSFFRKPYSSRESGLIHMDGKHDCEALNNTNYAEDRTLPINPMFTSCFADAGLCLPVTDTEHGGFNFTAKFITGKVNFKQKV